MVILRKKFIISGFLAATMLVSLPAFSEDSTTLSDLEAVHNARNVIIEPGKEFDKSHWAYQSLEYLSEKYGLLLGKFDENQPLTRNEAAVILVNLVGKIEKEKTKLSEAEQMQLKIMKNEFSNELTMLTGRIEKIEEDNKRTFKARIGENHLITGAIQAQYTGNFFGKGLDSRPSNFTIPVTDVTFKGELRPHLFYNINTFPHRNFTSSANSLLGDMYISTDIVPKHQIYFGQRRKPIGLEGTQSSYTLETVERAQIARIYGDKRDMGLTVFGDQGIVDYGAGVYNGSGMNTNDTNNSDLEYSLLASINPLHKTPQYGKLKLGGTYNHGKVTNFSHDLFGYFGEYKIGPYMIRGEWAKKNGHLAKNSDGEGWYIHNSYFVTDNLQLIGRMDMFDRNIHSGGDRLTEYTIGSNYYFREHKLKLMCDFVYAHNKLGSDSKRVLVLSQYLF